MISESSTDSRDVNPFSGGEELQQQLAEVKERLNEAKMELALQQSKHPASYDDFYFIEQLDGLRSQIRHWTATHFSHAGAYWTIGTERRFRELSENWAAYMEDEDRRPWLIQARIWAILQQLLFDSESDKQYSYLFTGQARNYSVDRMLERGSSPFISLIREG